MRKRQNDPESGHNHTGLASNCTYYLSMDEHTMSPRVITALLILVLHAVPTNPSTDYMKSVIQICTDIYEVNIKLCECIIEQESEWNPNARGDDGKAVGLWQWHEESIRYVFDDMGIAWDWKDDDPRLNVWASTLAACHALSKRWDWWSTQELCEEILTTAELE